MTDKDDGGQAFPRARQRGMTLRDYFAGQVLAARLANPDLNESPEYDCFAAYNYADAMLAERGGK